MTWPELWDAIEAANRHAMALDDAWHTLDAISAPTCELRLATQDAYDAYKEAHATYCALCDMAAERARAEARYRGLPLVVAA